MSFISDFKNVPSTIGSVAKQTFGPLAPLERGHFTKATLRYPLDVGDTHLFPHTIEFQCWLPDPVKIEGVESQPLRGPQASGGLANYLTSPSVFLDIGRAINNTVKKITSPIQQVGGGIKSIFIQGDAGEFQGPIVNQNQRLNNRVADFTRRATPSDLIALYTPAGMSWFDRHANDYQTSSLTNAMGTGIGIGLEVLASKTDAQKNGDSALNRFTGPAIEGLVSLVDKLTPGGVGDKQALTNVGLQALGYAINPQFEMVWGATEMREFQFEFFFTPRNKKEAVTVLEIIKTFKYHASAQYQPVGAGRYLTPPSYFDITFKFKGQPNKQLPRISTCVLKNIDINYGGGLETWATYEDGTPVQAQMVLTFVELEMMHKTLRQAPLGEQGF